MSLLMSLYAEDFELSAGGEWPDQENIAAGEE